MVSVADKVINKSGGGDCVGWIVGWVGQYQFNREVFETKHERFTLHSSPKCLGEEILWTDQVAIQGWNWDKQIWIGICVLWTSCRKIKNGSLVLRLHHRNRGRNMWRKKGLMAKKSRVTGEKMADLVGKSRPVPDIRADGGPAFGVRWVHAADCRGDPRDLTGNGHHPDRHTRRNSIVLPVEQEHHRRPGSVRRVRARFCRELQRLLYPPAPAGEGGRLVRRGSWPGSATQKQGHTFCHWTRSHPSRRWSTTAAVHQQPTPTTDRWVESRRSPASRSSARVADPDPRRTHQGSKTDVRSVRPLSPRFRRPLPGDR